MERLSGIAEAFAERNFRIYSIGSITSWITYFVQTIAFSWAAWEVTHSTQWLAIISLLTIVATVVFIPLGGVLADRTDRFRLLLAAYGCDAIKTVVLTVLALTGNLTLAAICISAFLHGLIHSFSIPASYGMMPRFVSPERQSAAIGVAAAYTQFAIFAGPALAGWILVHWGIAAAFATNVAGYAVFFASSAFLQTPATYRQPRALPKAVRQDMMQGARYIFSHQGLSSLLLLVLIGDAAVMAVNQMMPAYSENVLEMGVGGVSLMYGAAGIGATLSALWLAHGGATRATPPNVLRALLGVAVSVAAIAVSPSLIIAAAAMLTFGFCGELRRTATVALMQVSIDDSQRGRVMSSLFLLTQIAGGIGTLAVGFAAKGIGLRIPLALAAGLLGVSWIIIHRKRAQIGKSFGLED